MAEIGSVRNVKTEANLTVVGVERSFGEAEWAAIQTVHFDASAALEW